MLANNMIQYIHNFVTHYPGSKYECQRLMNMIKGILHTVDRRAVIRVLQRDFKYGRATTKGILEIQSRWVRTPSFIQ